ncbi:MAG: hypothetical protein ABIH78_03885, partial [Candidatus Peregrinibacteria bacterium]
FSERRMGGADLGGCLAKFGWADLLAKEKFKKKFKKSGKAAERKNKRKLPKTKISVKSKFPPGGMRNRKKQDPCEIEKTVKSKFPTSPFCQVKADFNRIAKIF